jgi:hypothetical protein
MLPKPGGEGAEARGEGRRKPAANAAEGPAANAAKSIALPMLLIDTQDVPRFCAERLHKQIIN